VAEEKRKLAKLEIERQKEIMQEKERVIQNFLKVNYNSCNRSHCPDRIMFSTENTIFMDVCS
jgi:hypothetical protein